MTAMTTPPPMMIKPQRSPPPERFWRLRSTTRFEDLVMSESPLVVYKLISRVINSNISVVE
jgi:hypothetical protein